MQQFADKKGVPAAQVALAWVRSYSETHGCGRIVPIPGATAESRVNENCKVVTLSASEKKELDETLARVTVVGIRGIEGAEHLLNT